MVCVPHYLTHDLVFLKDHDQWLGKKDGRCWMVVGTTEIGLTENQNLQNRLRPKD